MVPVEIPPLPSTRAHGAAHRLFAILRERIATGAFPQGAQLPTERDLAADFSVARNTVRRALALLERAGLVERAVGRGTFAKAPFASLEAGNPGIMEAGPADVLDARLALEPGMADLIVLRAGSREFEAMQATLAAADGAVAWQAFEQCDETFHHQLARATRNPMIVRIAEELARVRDHVSWGQIKARTLTAERRAAIQRDHYEILHALEARDAARARLAIRVHVLHVRDAMLDRGQ